MEQKFPLTKQQEGLWVEWRLHPDNTSYNTCVKLRLLGALDKERFEKALRDVVNYFSSLRVYFVEEQGIPYQCIKHEGSFVLEYKDISVPGELEESEQTKRKAEAFLAGQLQKPIDLKTFPIIRASLMKTAEQTHYFIGIVPHMISDGMSAVLFLEATSIAYNEGVEGLEHAYGGDKKEWADYFAESTTDHTEEKHQLAADYWQENLKDAQHFVDFSHGEQELQNEIKTGKRVYFDLSDTLSTQLKEYSRLQRTTLFSTLVASFSALVHRYYGQDEVLIGYPVNIRPAGYKHLFGFFVNIIPIRVDLKGDPSYQELVKRVSDARRRDKKHQTYPALEIVRGIRRQLEDFDGRVFNISMAQTVSRLVNLRLDGIISVPLEAEYNDVNDDLSLSYELLEDGRIGLWLEYRQSLFSKEFIEQMISHMESILQQSVQRPEAALSEFELLSPSEKIEQESALQGEHKKSNYRTIFDGFLQIAKSMPQAPALRDSYGEVSYTQLKEQAKNIAGLLINQGVKKGDRVALCLPRGRQMIAAQIGVMMSGAAYVPLSPEMPDERLSYIVDDADIVAILVMDAGEERFSVSDITACPRINIQTQPSSYDGELPVIHPDDFSYVIYTSGSTGLPKGVLLKHGQVISRIEWLRDYIALGAGQTMLQNTDYSFDVSVAEIFWPLSQGMTLVLTDSERYKDPSYLVDVIERENIESMCIVPSLLHAMLSIAKEGQLSSLKYALAAGEALPPTLVKTYYKQVPRSILYNVYGPTEAAVYTSYYVCPADDAISNIPIGRPLYNTALYVLDNKGRVQPNGVAGELYIGGEGVASGYVKKSDLTDAKFIDHQFEDGTTERLYRTGDLARVQFDGQVDYLGRIDGQVKIRGYRIELAEIESVLSTYEAIQEAVVIDYQSAGDVHKKLVAYYVSSESYDRAQLKEYLLTKLPSYMVPAFYVAIDEVPRLQSGKINRRMLPNPEKVIEKTSNYVPPSSELEHAIVDIWSEILRVPADTIGIHDNFFNIGGDSLMAIQFICKAEEREILFDVNSLVTHKTVAGLARVAVKGKASSDDDSAEVLSGRYGLLPRQQKFFDDGYRHPEHWNRLFYFEARHEVNVQWLEQAFEDVLAHHDNLRVRFLQDDGVWYQELAQEIAASDYIQTLDLSDVLEAEHEGAIRHAIEQMQASMKLEKAPLLRVLNVRLGSGQGKIVIAIHHLLVDMVSSRIIFEDLVKRYESYRNGLTLPLADKTSSIAQIVQHYHEELPFSDQKENALSYWEDDIFSADLDVLSDKRLRQNGVSFERDAVQAKSIINESVTQQLLKAIPQRLGVNIQHVILAAYMQAMQDWCGASELVVNMCGHGRHIEGANVNRSVGWLNTVYPVAMRYDQAKQSDKEYLTAVAEQYDAVIGLDTAFMRLKYCDKDPRMVNLPEARLFLNYVGQLDAVIPDEVSFRPVAALEGVHASHPDNAMSYDLYLEAGVIGGELHSYLTYSKTLFAEDDIQQFIHLFDTALKELASEGEKSLTKVASL